MSFTDKQLEVINHDDGNIVVSASAGSGKTRVMIERIIRLIINNKVDVRNILAVTFTRMAAQEMRDRLAKAFTDRIREGKDCERLKRQLKDLPLASISTIDSFLNTLIKKYFTIAQIDPNFTVIDEAQKQSLKNASIDEVFDTLYETNDADLNLLLKVFIYSRKDKNLKGIILNIYDFLESETDSQKFWEKTKNLYTKEGLKIAVNRLIAQYIEKFGTFLEEDLPPFTLGLNIIDKKFLNYIASIKALYDNLNENKTLESLFEISSATLTKPSTKKLEPIYADALDKLAKDFNELKKKIKTKFADMDDLSNIQESQKIICALEKVVGLFTQKYSEQKRELNCLDFGDISHIAYKVLQNQSVIEDLRATYKYIFVDEYQDTNGIQESIFTCLENNNLFIVGDIKQSIYGFRGCFSENFAKRMHNQNQKCVELDYNFRSSPEVIKTVNRIFSYAITKRTMGFNYSDNPMQYGGLYGNFTGETKLFYFDRPEKKQLKLGTYSVSKHLLSERNKRLGLEDLVTYTVKKALNSKVYDLKTGEERTATYSDIAILMRATKNGVDKIVKELERSSIPVVMENKRSIKSYPEIQQMIDILDCILSQTNDIPLASTLKSPVGGLKDSDLKAIKDSASSQTPFYKAVYEYQQKDDKLAQKIRDFYAYIKRLRLFATFEGVPTLIRRIMEEKSIRAKLLTTSGGEHKLSRIEVLIASAYKDTQEYFIQEFMENLDELLDDMKNPLSSGGNAVTITSMHSSKGLEYPIVIVAGIDKNWNKTEASKEIYFSRTAGIGIRSYDFNKKQYKSNYIREYIKSINEEKNLQEELRLFYVALTRVKCNLYLLTMQGQKNIKSLIDANKQIDFLFDGAIDVEQIYEEDLIEELHTKDRRELILPEPDPDLAKEIEGYVNYTYPYQKDTLLSLKRSVTKITQTKKDINDDEVNVVPIFAQSDIERGNAYHKFLELLDFSKIGDNGLIGALLHDNFTEEEQKIIDIQRVKKILDLPIFSDIKDYKLYKEQPFIVLIPPQMADEEGTEDILLQGVIDLICIKGDEAIIVDYKHSNKDKDRLLNTYKKQLDLYAYATEKAIGKKVVRKVLVNLLKIEQIEVN